MEGNLQSGFVLAAIITAVLLVGQIGGTDELVRRIYQVALAVIIVFTTFAGTTAFIRPPEAEGAAFEDVFGEEFPERDFLEDSARRDAVATSVHAGIGIIALLLGLISYRRMSVLPLGFAAGGLLLLLFGGSTAGGAEGGDLGSFLSIFGSLFNAVAGVSQIVDVTHFIVLLSGVVALIAFGFTEWEETAMRKTPPAPPADVGGGPVV